MESAGLISLGFLLIAAGIAILAASWRVSVIARGAHRRMEQLLELEHLALDPLDIPAAAWPILAAGGWKTLCWEGNWFGQAISGHLGARLRETANAPLPVEYELVSGDDVRLRLQLQHSLRGGESRLFAEPLARVFALLVETRARARTEALAAALAERARLSLYLQHDMRNLAQWVLWVSEDLAHCETGPAMLASVRRLRENTPLASERAHRLIAALGKTPAIEEPQSVDLADGVSKAAKLAGVQVELSGDANVWIAPGQLARVFDNLFSNLAPVWRLPGETKPSISLVKGGAEVTMSFLSPRVGSDPQPPIERLFEPFSTGRVGGLGLGLYQARKTLREAGGELTAELRPEGLFFVLRFRPCAESACKEI